MSSLVPAGLGGHIPSWPLFQHRPCPAKAAGEDLGALFSKEASHLIHFMTSWDKTEWQKAKVTMCVKTPNPFALQGVVTGIVSSGYGLSAAFVTVLFSFFGEDPWSRKLTYSA